jgi:ElaB/YqjD/DUF883 family membrane-anchored ribosome-binding protein
MFNKMTEASNSLLEQAAHSADVALHSSQRVANQAMEGVSHSLQNAGKQVRVGAQQASDTTIAFIREEPVKAMVIAAATGAALVALARLISRPKSQH